MAVQAAAALRAGPGRWGRHRRHVRGRSAGGPGGAAQRLRPRLRRLRRLQRRLRGRLAPGGRGPRPRDLPDPRRGPGRPDQLRSQRRVRRRRLPPRLRPFRPADLGLRQERHPRARLDPRHARARGARHAARLLLARRPGGVSADRVRLARALQHLRRAVADAADSRHRPQHRRARGVRRRRAARRADQQGGGGVVRHSRVLRSVPDQRPRHVDGGVGFSGHADLAAEAGADVVFVVNPLVPNLQDGNGNASMTARGMYTIMEQAGRIYSQNLLTLGLATLAVKFPRTAFFLPPPPRTTSLLFGPSMGFETSRAALRYGYTSTKEWLDHQGAPLVRRLSVAEV